MTRTDIHRPSSPDFDPEAYACWGVFDNHPEEGDGAARVKVIARLCDEGYACGAHSSGQCGHCGALIRYAALMVREDVKEYIFVGEDCLDNRFDALTKGEFQRLRKAAKLNRERKTRVEQREQFLLDNPGLEQALETDHYISDDLRGSLKRNGSLSEAQVALAFKIEREERERAERAAKREAEREALLAQGVRVPTGRLVITGTVLSIREQESAYGFQMKMLVQSDEGWKVWGTMPLSLMGIGVEVGDRVTFTAAISASDDDPVFGFYSRPTKAAIVQTA